jgi:Uma2 family endonuclease
MSNNAPATVYPPRPRRRRFPDSLLYEIIDGQRIAYKGYEAVLNNEKKREDIMGCSTLQATIIQLVMQFLWQNLPPQKYHLRTGELGLHLSHKTNVSADIAIFTTEQLRGITFDHFYATIPPKIVIEIDVKADTEALDMDYFDLKTRRLHEFGVERVIWIFTHTQKIHICEAGQDWIIRDWHKDAVVLDNIALNIAELLHDYDKLLNR